MMTRPADRVFPARAGVIHGCKERAPGMRCFPRTRGGDPFGILIAALLAAFSPHARG